MTGMKTPLFAAAVIATLGMGAFGASRALAAEGGNGLKPMDRLVTAIATKFNLNVDEVQAVFDEEKEAMHEEMQANIAVKIGAAVDEAVTAGKLSTEQAAAIKAKQSELQPFLESLKDKTEKERHEAMKAKMDEIQAWAKEQGIGPEFLRFGFQVMGRGGHAGPGPMMKKFDQKFEHFLDKEHEDEARVKIKGGEEADRDIVEEEKD
jgi:hypothetical protein